MAADLSSGICVFSPGLRLTVTAENGPRGEEIHLHPGGQGYWPNSSTPFLPRIRVDAADNVAEALTT